MPSNFDAEKRRLLHQKSQQLTTGYGQPNNDSGKDGDIAFRQVEGSGTVQYLKSNDEWVAVSSSGLMPPQRIMVGGGASSITGGVGGSTGVTDHGFLTGRDDDDHAQYVHINIARTISAAHAFTGAPTFTNGTFTSIDINGGTIDGTTISADSTQTEWDAAYTHSIDNTQAHSDYLLNNSNDTMVGRLTCDGLTIGTNENITLGLQTLSHNGNYFVFSDTITASSGSKLGNLTLGDGSIVDSGGSISFGDDNLNTSGTLGSGTITVANGGSIILQERIDFTGATLENQIRFPDNLTSALLIGEGTTPYVRFNSSEGNEEITLIKNVKADLDVDIDGDLDVDGITNLDVVDIDGAVNMASDLTVSGIVDITNTTDSSNDSGDTGALRVEGGASIAKKLYVGTNLDVDGTSNLDATDIDGNLQVDNSVTEINSSNKIDFNTVSSAITLDSGTNCIIKSNGTTTISKGSANKANFNTNGLIYFGGAKVDDIDQEYSINNIIDTYAVTWYLSDLYQNYSFLMSHIVIEGGGIAEVYP